MSLFNYNLTPDNFVYYKFFSCCVFFFFYLETFIEFISHYITIYWCLEFFRWLIVFHWWTGIPGSQIKISKRLLFNLWPLNLRLTLSSRVAFTAKKESTGAVTSRRWETAAFLVRRSLQLLYRIKNMFTVKMMHEPAISPRSEVFVYRLCKCERWNIAREDCGGDDNGGRSRCRLCDCSRSDLSRSSVCLGALSAPVAANKVVPRSPACQTELSLRDPGGQWGGVIEGWGLSCGFDAAAFSGL